MPCVQCTVLSELHIARVFLVPWVWYLHLKAIFGEFTVCKLWYERKKRAEGKKGGVNTYGTEKTPTGFKKPGNHWNLN